MRGPLYKVIEYKGRKWLATEDTDEATFTPDYDAAMKEHAENMRLLDIILKDSGLEDIS